MTWYYESDGGKTWVGHYWSYQPKTHYVTDREGGRIDCRNKREAKELRDKLNAGHQLETASSIAGNDPR